MNTYARALLGSPEDWKGGIGLILLFMFLSFIGFTLGVLGRSSFVGMAGPAVQPGTGIIAVSLGLLIAYTYHGILIAWVSGVAMFLTTAVHYIFIHIQAEAPVTFILEKLLMLIIVWGITFSSIGWIVGQGIAWYSTRSEKQHN